jgi:hypothetical protein
VNKLLEIASGFCPTQNCEYTIDVKYSHIADNRYLKVGATCDYCADVFGVECPIQRDCPLYHSMPKEIFC